MATDWGLYKEKGRCKDIGVPWSEEEMHARYGLGIPADLVRKGVLTLEEYEFEQKGGKKVGAKFMRSMTKEEVKGLAADLGIKVPKNAKRLEIISLIKKSNKKSKLPASDQSDDKES